MMTSRYTTAQHSTAPKLKLSPLKASVYRTQRPSYENLHAYYLTIEPDLQIPAIPLYVCLSVCLSVCLCMYAYLSILLESKI
jgi:hypothetical protein